MRTAHLAAALLVSLAACGGDGGLSLTEPHQLDLEACAPVASDLAGRWEVDEWGCEGRATANGAANCDPASLPWGDGEQITMARAGADYSLTIGGETVTIVQSSSASYGAELAAGGHIGITACGNGSVLVFFEADPKNGNAFGDAFAAYAHRR